MAKNENFGSTNIPRNNLTFRQWPSDFLPMVVLTLFLACGGGTKSTDVAEPGDQHEPLAEADPYLTDLVLGEGDELMIRVWDQEDLSRRVRLDRTGEFYYPFIGYIQAGGMSIRDLRLLIYEGLSRYYVDPQVGVEVFALRSQKIFVLGEVMRPGVFLLDTTDDVIEAVARAGGFTDDAHKASVILVRENPADPENPLLERINCESYLVGGRAGGNRLLQGGDVVYVPRSFVGDLQYFGDAMWRVLRPIVLLERAVILAPAMEDVLTGEDRVIRIR